MTLATLLLGLLPAGLPVRAPARAHGPPHLPAAAATLLACARAQHQAGAYAAAAACASQAMVDFPLLGAARLALGKVLLARGSAEHDVAALAEARRLFVMAAALDPGAAEPRDLLRLVDAHSAI